MFRKIIFITAVITACNWQLTAGRRLPDYDPNTINTDSESLQNGFYGYSYSSVLDGISAHESGYIKNPKAAKKDQISAKKGCYSFSSPEGAFISVLYVADERGYRPVTRITYPSQATHAQHLAQPCASLEQPVQIPVASSSTTESVGRDDQNFEVTPKTSTSTTEPNLEEVTFTAVNSVTSESTGATANEDLNVQTTVPSIGPTTAASPAPGTEFDSIGQTTSEPIALSTGGDNNVDGPTTLADSVVTRQVDGTTVPTTLTDVDPTTRTDGATVPTTLADSFETTTQTDGTTVQTTLSDFVVKTQTYDPTGATTLADSDATTQKDVTIVPTTLADSIVTDQTDGTTVRTLLTDSDATTQRDGATVPVTLADSIMTDQMDGTTVRTTLADSDATTQTDRIAVPTTLTDSDATTQRDGATVPTTLADFVPTTQADVTDGSTTLSDSIVTIKTDGATTASTLTDLVETTDQTTLADSISITTDTTASAEQTEAPSKMSLGGSTIIGIKTTAPTVSGKEETLVPTNSAIATTELPTTLTDKTQRLKTGLEIETPTTTELLATNLSDSGLPTTVDSNSVTTTTLALTTPPIETHESEEFLDYDAVVTYVRHSRAAKS